MKLCYLWIVIALMMGACRNKINQDDLPSLAWKPVDSVFSYYIEKDGDHLFKSGDLLGIELIGGLDKKSHRFSPLAAEDSAYAKLVTTIAGKFLDNCLNNKIQQNAEGYIKADLARLFPDQQIVITVYLKEDLIDAELDSFKRYISKMPEISAQHYTSKEEAKRQFLGAGNADFSAVLDRNPLPASIELTIREDYCTKDKLIQLKNELEDHAPFVVSEVRLPDRLYPELRKVKTLDCIFHFKT